MHIIFASTSGHTEFVVDTLIAFLHERAPEMQTEKQRVERANADDLAKGDVLILASSTWNTGSVEGQLNPHMFTFLRERAKDADLRGKKVAVIGLGDERYFYTARAFEHLEEYVKTRGGNFLLPGLKIVNEPYGQEEKIRAWGEKFLSAFRSA